jgi:hypothetical protein
VLQRKAAFSSTLQTFYFADHDLSAGIQYRKIHSASWFLNAVILQPLSWHGSGSRLLSKGIGSKVERFRAATCI